MTNTLAPIALFVFNRPWHTQQTIEALLKNELAGKSELFVYSDGPRLANDLEAVQSVRAYIRSITGFKTITVIERENNIGLAWSIISGVTEIMKRYDKVIVLEDDLVSSRFFLKFMNDGLERYKYHQSVMHISGYMFPIDAKGLPETFFYRSASCWGWATWSRAWSNFRRDSPKLIHDFSKGDISRFNIDDAYDFWSQIKENQKRRIETWAIFWYASVFQKKGLCLHPSQSLIQNIGHDNSGAHCKKTNVFTGPLRTDPVEYFEPVIEENVEAVARLRSYFRAIRPSFFSRVRSKISRTVAQILPKPGLPV
jgi:hypothetical protein